MNSHLIKKDLKRHRKQIYIWVGVAALLTLLSVAFFPLLNNIDMGEMMIEMSGDMTEGEKDAMQMSGNPFATILGLYQTYYGFYIMFVLSLFIMTNGVNIFGKEVRMGTSEFLYTRPITRKQAFGSKIMSLFILLMIAAGLQTLIAFGAISGFRDGTDVDWGHFAIMQIHGFSLQFFFACLGVLLIMYTNQKKGKTGLVIGLIFGFFVLNLVSKIHENVEFLKYFSPFSYVETDITNPELALNYWGVIGLIITGVVAVIVAKTKFEKMDLV
jgi:ABC-2 type transport system permease protein